jgi:hypothetical protein
VLWQAQDCTACQQPCGVWRVLKVTGLAVGAAAPQTRCCWHEHPTEPLHVREDDQLLPPLLLLLLLPRL